MTHQPPSSVALSLDARLGSMIGYIKLGAVVVLIGIGFVYLLLLNSLATKGFVLEELKEDRLVLRKQVEAMDIELAIPTSLYALESSEDVQSMPNRGQSLFLVVDQGGFVYVDGIQ